MKRRNASLIAAASAAVLLLTGCTTDTGGDTPNETKPTEPWVWTPEEFEDATPAVDVVYSKECNNRVKVIGLGNPQHGNDVDQHLYYAPIEITQRFMPEDFSTAFELEFEEHEPIEVQYPDSASLDSLDDLTKGDDSYIGEAAKSVITKIDEVSKECPGSQIVLRGHGMGAEVIRNASQLMGEYRAQQIAAVWLSSDPTRNADEKVALVPGLPDLGFTDESYVDDDPTADGAISGSGIRGAGGAFPAELAGKVLTTCYFNDPVCNAPEGFIESPYAFYEEHGGLDAVWTNHLVKYAGLPVTVPASEWVANAIRDHAQNVEEQTNAYAHPHIKPQAASYSNYVNNFVDDEGKVWRHPGAKVLQETDSAASKPEQCPDYTIIGVRGSGENIDGNVENEGEKQENKDGFNGGLPPHENAPVIDGFPAFLATYAWDIKNRLPSDQTVRFVPVYYHGLSLDDTLKPALQEYEETGILTPNFNFKGYFDSVANGVENLSDTHKMIHSECPDTSVAIIGYSQGSQVAHTYISTAPRYDLAEKVETVIMISDPLRIGSEVNQSNYDPRNAPNQWQAINDSWMNESRGSWALLINESLSEMTLPISIDPSIAETGHVIQVCDPKDIVCHVSPHARIKPHSEGYNTPNYYQFPSHSAAETLRISQGRQR